MSLGFGLNHMLTKQDSVLFCILIWRNTIANSKSVLIIWTMEHMLKYFLQVISERIFWTFPLYNKLTYLLVFIADLCIFPLALNIRKWGKKVAEWIGSLVGLANSDQIGSL